MDKEKIIKFMWGCITIIFVAFYIGNLLTSMAVTWKTSNGSTISFDGGGLAELVIVCAGYYITKLLIEKDK